MSVVPDYGAHVNAGIDAGLDPIPDDCPELAAPGIDITHKNSTLVESEVGNLGSSAEITFLTDDAVTNVIVVRHAGAFHNY